MMGKKEQTQPYKSFETEEEWQEAIRSELLGRIKNVQEAKKKSQGAEEIKKAMLEAEARIKEQVPEFDLAAMLRDDPEFRERILKGYSVEDAFYLSNRKKAEEPKRKTGMRENGRSNFMGAGTGRNVANMSDEDFKKYIDSIKGSRI